MAWLHLMCVPFVLTYLMQPARLPGGSHGHRSVVERHGREQGAWQQPIGCFEGCVEASASV